MKKQTILLIVTTFLFTNINAQDFEYDPAEYGTGTSVGFALLGDAVAGVAVKVTGENQNQWDFNLSFTSRQEIFIINQDVEFGETSNGVSFIAGYNLFRGSRYKQKKNKVIKNYISPRVGLSYRGEPEFGIGVVWHRQAFRANEKNYSRGFDLGFNYRKIIGDGLYLNSDREPFDSTFNVFIRFDWNWFK